MDLAGKKILVVGANGFVGSRLCEILAIRHEAKVIGLVRNLGKAARIGRLGIDIIRGDATDKQMMEKLISGCDVVVNLLTGGDIVKGTQITAAIAQQHNIHRYVNMSTAAVYGIYSGAGHTTEAAQLKKTGNAYSDAKIKAEGIVNQQISKGLRAISLRPRVIWGPYSFWVRNFFEDLSDDNKFCLINNGAGACNTIFIDNLVAAIIWGIQEPEGIGETFFVTDGEQLTFKDYYQMLADIGDRQVAWINTDIIYSPTNQRSHTAQWKNFLTSSSTRKCFSNFPPTAWLYKGIYTQLTKLNETQKLNIKSRVGLSWDEANLREINSVGVVRPERIPRETGTGFTSSEKIKKAGFMPPLSIKEAAALTKEWLTFYGYR